MSTQQHPAVVATSSHWLVGNILCHGMRIQDVLMDPNTDAARLTDVKICGYAGVECLKTAPHAVVPKKKIELLLIPSSQHEAPMRRLYKYTQKRSYRAFVVVGEYCVEGAISLPSPPKDPVHTLAHQIDRFFPVTQASISTIGGEPFDSPILLANKEYVTCFHVGEEIVPEGPFEEKLSAVKTHPDAFEAESLSLLEGLGLLKETPQRGRELQES